MTQNNLGVIYVRRISSDSADNLEKAIASFEKALQVRTREALPINWAMTQMNLGTAYHSRISGSDRTENSEKAIKAYEQALKVFTPEADPIKCLEAFQNLGNLYFTQGDWEQAIDVYENAITVAELIRSRATTDENRQKIMEKAIAVYQKQVQAYINIQQWDKAIETVERSKARNLVELLTNRDFYPKGNVPQEMIAELDRLRRSIPSLERQLQVIMDQLSGSLEKQQPQHLPLENSRQRLKEELQESRQQLNEVLNQIKPFDPSFSLTQKIETIRFREIQSLVDEQTAMIQWYFTGDGLLTSIITRHGSQVIFASSSAEDREVFANWAQKYLGSYSQQREQWKNELPSHIAELAEILKIDEILAEINQIFACQGIKCDRLILIPHRILHLLPLHALPLGNRDLLCDRFPRGLSYAPSIQLLQLSQSWSRPSLKSFFSVKNPTEDLSFAELEVDTIRNYFYPNDDVLERQQAQKTALTSERLAQTNVAHFSCHGYFNFETPSQSALLLAGSKKVATTMVSADKTRFWASRDGSTINLEKCLTLGDIFALELRQCRLTTLSACETGLTDLKSLSDEYIGLPSGFLYAGSPSVVSSLWTVDDLSTAFLIIQFYKNLQDSEHYPSVAIALNQAQLWLRNLTKKELQEWISENKISLDATLSKSLRRRLHKMSDNEQPFKSPFHWAAFCAIGQ